jgi:hypothetical protein
MSIDQYQHSFRAVAAPATYLFFGVLAAFFLSVAVYVGVNAELGWTGAAVILGFPAFLIGWVCAFRLEISNGVLFYRTLLRGTRSIALSAIGRADTAIAPEAPFGPFFRLTIYPSGGDTKPIVINMKVFSMHDIDRLIDILGAKFEGPRRYSVFRRRSAR